MQPPERPTDEISADATICEAQIPAFFIGMPFPRTQQKDISRMDGDGAVDGAVEGFAADDQGNFKKVVLVQRRIALVHRAINVNRRADGGKELLAAQKFRGGCHGLSKPIRRAPIVNFVRPGDVKLTDAHEQVTC